MSLISFSQEGTSSPYSFFGIGEARFHGSVESRSMAGISMIPDSTRINFQNPAGFANLKWTAFTMAASSNYSKQKEGTNQEIAQRTTFDYLSLGIPLGKFGAAFGITPFSSVGYKVENVSDDPDVNSKRLNGWGGVNRVFIGAGYRVLPNLSVGANVYYNFGKIQTNSLEFIPDVAIGSRELNVNQLSGVNYNLGLMYQAKIKDKLNLFTSLYYTPESVMSSENTRNIGTVSFNTNYVLVQEDSFDEQIIETDLKLPQKWSLGLGLGDQKKWLFGGEVSFQDVGELYNIYNDQDNVTYGEYEKYSFGGYFTPSVNPFVGYAKRVTYRGGFKFEKTGLIVDNTSIDDVAVSFGFGLPITGSLSNVNLGFEFGKKGTTANNLVQENYINLSVGVSLNDKWFVRSKYR